MRDSLVIHAMTPKSGKSAFRAVSEIVRIDAPEDEVQALFEQLIAIRGVHRVAVKWKVGSVIDGKIVDSPWRRIYLRGTQRAQLIAEVAIIASGLTEMDRNADHDHARCIASARKQGVPAAWAHMPETYLSS